MLYSSRSTIHIGKSLISYKVMSPFTKIQNCELIHTFKQDPYVSDVFCITSIRQSTRGISPIQKGSFFGDFVLPLWGPITNSMLLAKFKFRITLVIFIIQDGRHEVTVCKYTYLSNYCSDLKELIHGLYGIWQNNNISNKLLYSISIYAFYIHNAIIYRQKHSKIPNYWGYFPRSTRIFSGFPEFGATTENKHECDANGTSDEFIIVFIHVTYSVDCFGYSQTRQKKSQLNWTVPTTLGMRNTQISLVSCATVGLMLLGVVGSIPAHGKSFSYVFIVLHHMVVYRKCAGRYGACG